MNEIIIILSRWLHLLGTVVWIGAIILLLFVITPSVKEVLGSAPESKKLLKSIEKRAIRLVSSAIIIVIISGILLAVSGEQHYTGSFIFTTKVLLAFMMVGIHFSRHKIIAPLLEKMATKDPTSESFIRLQKLQKGLVWVNLMLGLAVLFLSVML